jgi:hypothetical protein
MKVMLSEKQAYMAMVCFLERLQERTKSDDLAGYLGDLQINGYDGMPMDSAMWSDWEEAVNMIICNNQDLI